MKTQLTMFGLLLSSLAFGQVRPDQQPAIYADNLTLSNEVYTLDNGSVKRILFQSLDSLLAAGGINEITNVSDTSTLTTAQLGDIAINSSNDTLMFRSTYGWIVFVGGGGGGSGDVTGPASSTDNAVVRFNGTTGKTAQNSGVLIDDSNNLSGIGNITLTGTVDGIDVATDVAANTTKVTNQTHTGDVTGSTELTIQPAAIGDHALATAVAGDTVLIKDATDGALKKAVVNDFLDNTDAQTLSFSSPNVSITGGNSVDISGINTDAQTLLISNDSVAISGGNTTRLHIAGGWQYRYSDPTKSLSPYFANPLYTAPSAQQTRDPSNVIYWGGKYYFYGSWFPDGQPAADSSHNIVVFESLSPFGPYVFVDTVVTRGATGDYDGYSIFTPTAVVNNDSIFLFYSAVDTSLNANGLHFRNIGLAASTSPTSGFTKRSSPIFQNSTDAGAGETWESLRIDEFGPIRINDTLWRAYYKGVEDVGAGSLDRAIAYAETTSSNFPGGWSRIISSPLLEDSPGGADLEDPAAWFERGKYYILASDSDTLHIYSSVSGTGGFTLSNQYAHSDILGDATIPAHGFDLIAGNDEPIGIIFHYGDPGGTVFDVKYIGAMTSNISSEGMAGQWSVTGSNLFYEKGNVGIGAAPTAPLHVENNSTGAMVLLKRSNSSSIPSIVSNKSLANTTEVTNNTQLIRIDAKGYYDDAGGGYASAAQIDMGIDSTGTISNTSMPGFFSVKISENGTTAPVERLRVSNEGKLTINGINEAGFHLYNEAATFGNELQAGGTGNPNYIANWKGGAQDDTSKPSWMIQLRVSNDDLRIRRAPAAGGFSDMLTINSTGHITINGGPKIVTGSGSPEGVITAPVGSMYMRTDGGAGTTLYVKESGAGNTGWIAK